MKRRHDSYDFAKFNKESLNVACYDCELSFPSELFLIHLALEINHFLGQLHSGVFE